MASPSTILEATALCRRTFEAATQYSRLMTDEWAENRLADFKLWAKGAGAFAPGRASLDHRLSSNIETHNIILNLLLMLTVLVEDCISAAMDSGNTAVGGKNPGAIYLELSKEELMRMEEVDGNLQQLTRVIIAIRKAGTRSRLEKADATFDPDSAPIRAFRRHLELLVQLRPGREQTSNSISQDFDREILTTIQLRLIDANLRRRNRFLYAQKHAEKLGSEARANPKPSARVEGTETPLLSLHCPPTIKEGASLSTENVLSGLKLQSATTATVLDESVVSPLNPMAAPATTTVLTATTSQVLYPAPPPIGSNQGIFRCPCCCQSLPVGTGRGRHWKKHLTRDIMPYSCILPDCPHPLRFYLTKEAWGNHMSNEHPGLSQWVCQLCLQRSIYLTFKQPDALASHLTQNHSKGIKAKQIPTLLSAWKRRFPVRVSHCPLCDFENDEPALVLDHAAEHIHAFALRSLPWPPNEDMSGDGCNSDVDDVDYFKQYPYFGSDNSQSGLSSKSVEPSDEPTDPEGLDSPDLDIGIPLTKEALQNIIEHRMKHEDTDLWLERLEAELHAPSTTIHKSGWQDLTRESLVDTAIRFNEYFLDGTGIHREVIQADICRYLGNDALVKPMRLNGHDGYHLRTNLSLNDAIVTILKEESTKWEEYIAGQQHRRSSEGILSAIHEPTSLVEPAEHHVATAALEDGRPGATTEFDPKKARIEWPDPVRWYTQRTFWPQSQRSHLDKATTESRLRSILTKAVENDLLESTDWDSLPLPQSTAWDSMEEIEGLRAHTRRGGLP